MLVASPPARQGRELQRYEGDGTRLITGCVPFYDGKLVMVSSQSGGWICPKGGWEKDETVYEGAQREAYEEAGVLGSVGPALPEISFRSKSGNPCRLLLFVMEVTKVLTDWPEQSCRKREFLSLDEGISKCSRPEIKQALMQMRKLGLHHGVGQKNNKLLLSSTGGGGDDDQPAADPGRLESKLSSVAAAAATPSGATATEKAAISRRKPRKNFATPAHSCNLESPA